MDPLYFFLDDGVCTTGLFRLRQTVGTVAFGQLYMLTPKGRKKWRDWCVDMVPGGILRNLSEIERKDFARRKLI